MQWSSDAEAALKKVPFFVRKKVRRRVEQDAKQRGRSMVTLQEVQSTQQRYLKQMSKEITGYQLDRCFGPSGCLNRSIIDDSLIDQIEHLLKKADLRTFLLSRVKGELKFHREFRVTLADCPNACSQPQIKDVGIIGACIPTLTNTACTHCRACETICKENAIALMDPASTGPDIDFERCIACGQCITACSSGTLVGDQKGYRVQLGGKLGRHPQLARELPGIFDREQVMKLLQYCLDLFMLKSRDGQKLGEILTDADLCKLVQLTGSSLDTD